MWDRYKIVRHYFQAGCRRRTITQHLTLEQAQRHCQDVETSWKTCKKPHNVRRTRERGPWFDGYERE